MFSVPRGPSAIALVALLSTGCLFPEYTFDEPEPSGGGGGTSSTGGQPPVGGGGNDGGTGGTGGTGGMPPVEDCFTAGDEDDNGTADCADPACTPDLECAPAIPVGWGTYGHAALFRGSAASDPACPPGTETDSVYAGNANLANTDAECDDCSCAAPMGRVCAAQDIDPSENGLQPVRLRDATCAGSAGNFDPITAAAGWDGACSALDSAPGGGACPGLSCNLSVAAIAARPAGGSCTATGGAPSAGDPTWTERVKACESSSQLQGCDSGLSCVPRPSAPYDDRICIGRAGDQDCPADYPLRRESFSGFTDDRECSECTCGAPTGGTCKLNISVFNSATCGGTALATIETSNTACGDLTVNQTVAGISAVETVPPAGGSCAVTGGGVPSGSVTPTGQTTFCCLPSE